MSSNPGEAAEQSMLEHMERQTKALESLNTYFMRFLAVATLLALIWLIAVLSG